MRLLLTDRFDSTLNIPSEQGSTLSYTPYGHITIEKNSKTLLGFTGQYIDTSIACYFLGNGHRIFNPILMRFHNADGESPFAMGGINAYCYCGNDPINKYDPTGRSSAFPPASGFQYQGKARVINKMRVFYSTDPDTPGGSILNINTHGSAGFLWSKWYPQTAKKIAKTLESHGYYLNGQRTHFISCHSACKPFWGKALNAQMSKITEAPSTGYKGRVTTYPANPVRNTNTENFAINVDTKNPFDEHDRRFGHFRYEPVTVYPGSSKEPMVQRKNLRTGQN